MMVVIYINILLYGIAACLFDWIAFMQYTAIFFTYALGALVKGPAFPATVYSDFIEINSHRWVRRNT